MANRIVLNTISYHGSGGTSPPKAQFLAALLFGSRQPLRRAAQFPRQQPYRRLKAIHRRTPVHRTSLWRGGPEYDSADARLFPNGEISGFGGESIPRAKRLDRRKEELDTDRAIFCGVAHFRLKPLSGRWQVPLSHGDSLPTAAL